MKWLEEDLSGVRIHEKLREEGVKLGYSTVKDYICKIKKRENIFIIDNLSLIFYYAIYALSCSCWLKTLITRNTGSPFSITSLPAFNQIWLSN